MNGHLRRFVVAACVATATACHEGPVEPAAPTPLRDGDTVTFAGNPLFWGADPAAHVWADGKLWIYPTTDAHDWDTLTQWNAWSTEDLRTWTFHERIFAADQCGWCVNNAWAPDVAYRNGLYYLYYYFRNDGAPPRGVGVAVSPSPAGPFVNVSVEGPLFDGHDPAVFVDDDGQAYLYTAHVIRFLEDDMVHLQQEGDGDRQRIVELRGHDPVGGWEDVWVFKREGRYYFTLADDDYRRLVYYMGASPTGPFDYGGVLLPKVQGTNVHHSVVEFQGRWILWYHLWPEGGPGQRQVNGEILDFNPDGTIRSVEPTSEGVG